MELKKSTFELPKNFFLGASSSAWQTEGWTGKKDGQDSYMDLWYKSTPHLWHNGYGPTLATDFYRRYKEDAKLMSEVGLQKYRTSIDWSRFIKDYETAEVDEEALEYYNNMIDEVIKNGVEPMICLEHYELPAVLFEEYGGWGSKHVVNLFVEYAKKAFEAFGHKVKYWFTFNEPIVVQTRVYLDAIRWPFEQNTRTWMQWNYNKILATAKVVEAFKLGEIGKDIGGKIGVILNPEVTYARSSAPHDMKAAEMYDLFFNRLYLDPSVKGEIPAELFEILQKHDCLFEYNDEELAVIKNNTVDLLGLNLYFPHRVKARTNGWNPEVPFHPSYYYDMFDLPGKKMNPHRGWEIYPKIMYDMAMRIKNEYGNIEWFIAENGMGVEGEAKYKNEEGIIQDDYRIEFISDHLIWLLKAVEEGCNCIGYMLWAFTDNVSPQNAFKNRYGLIEINLEDDRNRIIKKSGRWFKKISTDRCFEAKNTETVYK
ncbi:beta-glucosidase [Clostridium saccharoperbutylacetonicum]|uniref:6-phospho-beta-glucosidase GmuD n=1 Tax=Clostridium saccharoperbutylacetonicum N1-4(HMT) TaxID=931276 RepID=M1MTT1_9CLOT|nr:glycoside hydrolase family 1 protein [Clostridium saccharoperbutylacetonicum]AGF58111.1 6-phospho-beta-glucosidase GmuD [Clostridium saccharoperbutylacetonicum N1-4(HMT)]NRT61115.1 beta-glucosidase [Clostridium saccharoperbutylacetonicum]NSB24430.1 beta-glucosidase [Clostridium saccharoperbutylacetonicum]NSB43806.1 beta-glucosidase [Clostridium saccharoperbutylacetonicum]